MRSGAEAPDVQDTEWYRFTESIEDLLITGEYGWARATLKGIVGEVMQGRAVTEAHRRRVAGIVRGHARGGRYEQGRQDWRQA